MRKSKLMFVALLCAFFASVNTYANTPANIPADNPNEIRQEILKLVKSIDISDIKADYERTYIQFIVNSKNEIIVVNVSNSEFEARIKSKLNYRKLKTADVKQNEIYTVPLVFKKK